MEIFFLHFPANGVLAIYANSLQIICIKSQTLFSGKKNKNKKNIINSRISPARGILNITKTCLYNFDPLEPHFYTVKLGFTGVYIIFLITA